MCSIENIAFEDPFEVTVEIHGEQWKVTILPSYDHQKMESDFMVAIGDKFMGRLQMQILPRAWFWAEGNLSPIEAEIIGREIDKYYGQEQYPDLHL
ncbi:hypothetical protein [Desertivirga arenae]|uniref:hypothetical protein n=1 Tax=Desertivirga arenae TaxID=2810309 RepID=UPI001A96A0FB|nr:hypothetical protein [Pedobacter sp. SYSU D00823]